MAKLKWLFFDVGSTLVDESDAVKERFEIIAKNANVSYEEVERKAIDLYKHNEKGDSVIASYYNVEKTSWDIKKEKLYPDAKDCLEKLHERFKIGIIANQSEGLKQRLEDYGILPFIDVIVSSFDEGVSKPDPKIFRLALKKAGCNPSEALMIGDRLDNDIIPAKSVGMKTCRLLRGYALYMKERSEEEMANFVVESLNQVVLLLDKIAK